MKMRSYVCLDLKDGRRLSGPNRHHRWFLRWLFRLSAAGRGPALVLSRDDGGQVVVAPGAIEHALVAAYEGPR